MHERLKRELEKEKERQQRLPEAIPEEEVKVSPIEVSSQAKEETRLSQEDIEIYGSILEELKKVAPPEKAERLVDELKGKLLQRMEREQKGEPKDSWQEELAEDVLEGDWQEEVGSLELIQSRDPLPQERDWSKYAQRLKRKIKQNR